MALTATEEAQVKALIAQNAALLSLASSEPTIISKLAATKVSLADLSPATTVADSDLFLVRQGSTEKSITKSVLAPIATNAEAQAFTAGKLIDGAKLAAALQGANQSLTTNGYQKLPGGLIIQWGRGITIANQDVTVNWPISFSVDIYSVTSSQGYTNGTGTINSPVNTSVNPGLSSCVFRSATSSSFYWIAIGR